MEVAGVELVSVLVAAAASFLFGSLYYFTLARPWREAVGKSEEEIAIAMSARTFIVAALAQLVMAFMLAGVLMHIGIGSIRAGMLSATFLWFGFVLTTMTVNHGFQGARRSLTLIDGGHWLGVLLIQGAILGWWGEG
ncbi:MAG: DUF1761 domain-containing protein [Alphaproteobacteria bacterium]|nr:DUF1761 domain-containing protein [Alphaproteobacteria bacterium]